MSVITETFSPGILDATPELIDLVSSPSSEVSALILKKAPFERRRSQHNGRIILHVGWFDDLELYEQDRSTELCGSLQLADMPPHLDPHPRSRIKLAATTIGLAQVRFVPDIFRDLLDEHNELPGSDYAPVIAAGFTVDEAVVAKGDIAIFNGSTTLHEFKSITSRETLINSYRPL